MESAMQEATAHEPNSPRKGEVTREGKKQKAAGERKRRGEKATEGIKVVRERRKGRERMCQPRGKPYMQGAMDS